MAVTATGIEVPAGSDPFDPAGDMVDLANSLRSRIVVPVANATERSALIAAIDWTPSSAEPLRVWRANAAVGWQEEITTDNGVTWLSVRAVADSGWVSPATLPPAWDTNSATFKTRKIGNQVEWTGLLRPDAGTIGSSGPTTTGIFIAAGHARPGATLRLRATGWVAGVANPFASSATVEVAQSGEVFIYAPNTLTGVFVDGINYSV